MEPFYDNDQLRELNWLRNEFHTVVQNAICDLGREVSCDKDHREIRKFLSHMSQQAETGKLAIVKSVMTSLIGYPSFSKLSA